MSAVRISLVLLACLLVIVGLAFLITGNRRVDWLVAAYFIVGGVVLLVGVVFERQRYSNWSLPTEGWQPTGERFVDPRSG